MLFLKTWLVFCWFRFVAVFLFNLVATANYYYDSYGYAVLCVLPVLLLVCDQKMMETGGIVDSDLVTSRYAKDAVLLPTVSDLPRTDHASIKAYFDLFLKLKPQGVVLSSFVTIGDGWCKDVGIYKFTMRATGDKVMARYSFVYVQEDGQWKISHHHSSAMPEGGKPQITEEQVQNLFHLWNNALATCT